MRAEKARADIFTIFDAPSLDPITVILQDLGAGQGRIIIECYGQAWATYWGAMGDSRIREFILDCSDDYIMGRLLPTKWRPNKNDKEYLLRIIRAVKQALALPVHSEVSP